MFSLFNPILASMNVSMNAMSGISATKLLLPDYLIFATYLIVVIGVGIYLKRHMKNAEDFLLSGRSIPGWVTGLAFISANLGAQELIGMTGNGAKYGIMTSHYYWIGAIPAMVFLGVFMMPMYYGSKARSVPDYLKMRYDDKTRTFNSISFAVMMLFSSGISMHALADLMHTLLKVNYHVALLVTSAIVLAYVLKGGLSSAIYNEVLQFFMIIFGIAPLVYLAIHNVGGWDGLVAKLNHVDPEMIHSWKYTGGEDNKIGVPWYSLVFGLGFVLSFGYWCTNFAEVQRALAAKNMGAARRTPIIAAIPKMLFPAIVIVPGLIAMAATKAGSPDGYTIPLSADGSYNYNVVLPSMIFHYFPNGLLGLALTALMASFMSGMAANVTAFNTVWTYDIYSGLISKEQKTDQQLMSMGRMATIAGIVLSIGCAYIASEYDSIMDLLQTIFGFINAPLFATFIMGMFTKRSNSGGAFWGLTSGTLGAILFHGLSISGKNLPGIKGGWIHPLIHTKVELAQGIYIAIVAFCLSLLVNLVFTLVRGREKSDEELAGLVYSLTPKMTGEKEAWYMSPTIVGVIVCVICFILNVYFW